MKRRSHFLWNSFLMTLTFTVLMFSTIQVVSQSNSSGDEQVVDTSGKPTAVALTEINEQIEESRNRVKSISSKSVSEKQIQQLDSALPAVILIIEEDKKNFETYSQKGMSKGMIDNLQQTWKGHYDKLDEWQDKVNDIIIGTKQDLEDLAEQDEIWKLTYNNARNSGYPKEIISSIKDFRKTIAAFQKEIKKRQKQLLILENKAAVQKTAISSTQETIQVWKTDLRDHLFYRNVEPLWSISSDTTSEDEINDNIKMTLKSNNESVVKYVDAHKKKFNLHVLLIVLTAFFIYFIRMRLNITRSGQLDSIDSSNLVIFQHPIATILFTSALWSIAIYPYAPLLLNQLIKLWFIVSMLPVLPKITQPRFKWLGYVIIGMFLLHAAESMFWQGGKSFRWYFMFESAMGLGAVAYFVRPSLFKEVNQYSFFWKAIIWMSPILYLLMGTALIGNLLGYLELAGFSQKLSVQTAVVTTIFFGIIKIFGGAISGVIRWLESETSGLHLHHFKMVEKRLLWLINLFGFVLWIKATLTTLEIYDDIYAVLEDFLLEEREVGTLSITFGGIVSFVVILILSFGLARFVKVAIDDGLLSPLKLKRGVPAAVSLVVRYFVITMGIILALSAAGVDLGKFNLLAGALGVGIGFGLQNVVYNFIAGMILVFERPIQVDDTVELGTLLGKVKRIGVRSSNVRTFDGAEVVVPNGNLISNELINWTLSDRRKRHEIKINTTYAADPNVVLELLKKAALSNEDVLDDPEPLALFESFGEYSLNFRLLFWVYYDGGLSTKSNVSIAIFNTLKENGIEIPYPQQQILIKGDIPKKGKN